MQTTYERGQLEGFQRGIAEGQRKMALRLLEAKFGPLSAEVKQRVEALAPEQIDQLSLDLFKSQSLEELHLEN